MYGETPPLIFKETKASLSPKQLTSSLLSSNKSTTGLDDGPLTNIEGEIISLFDLSFKVTLNSPLFKFDRVFGSLSSSLVTFQVLSTNFSQIIVYGPPAPPIGSILI